MKHLSLLILAAVFCTPAGVPGQEAHYPDARELAQAMRSLAHASSSRKIEVIVLGNTLEGREILALRIQAVTGAVQGGLPENLKERSNWKSGLLVVSGLESHALVGSSVILDLARRLSRMEDKAFQKVLKDRILYLVPRLNLDGAQRFFLEGARSPEDGNRRPLDLDRDGRGDAEDPAQDMNGDGFITSMRQVHPRGSWIEDPEHPGRLRKADTAAGEIGTFRLFVEGTDSDGDGDIAEDGVEGVRLDHNFPHAFKEHHLRSGRYATSEPATRALVSFLVDRPWIESVLVYGTHDNLKQLPPTGRIEKNTSRFRRKPATKHHKEDVALYKAIAEKAEEFHALLPSRRHAVPGSFEDWAYFHRGLIACSINLFDVPDLKDKPSTEKSDTATRPTSRKSTSRPASSSPADAITKALREVQKTGWVKWTPFEHPTLGAVEIGGWKPFVRMNPPTGELVNLLGERQWPFLKHLLSLHADLEVENPACTEKGAGLYEIEIVVRNKGAWPSRTRQGELCQTARPDLLLLDLSRKRIIQGERLTRLGRLEARAGRQHVRWLITGKSKEAVTIYLAPSFSAPSKMEVVLP